MSSALSIRQLTKTYGNGFQALSGIDLDVAEGDFFALLGPNGAGKSTTIGILSTLVNKTSGTVNIFGHDLDKDPAGLKRSIGVVPQEFNFNQFEKTFDIVVTQAGYYGIPAKIAKERAEQYLTQLGLWDKRDVKIMALSGGMKRRVLIAKALAHEPTILFLDEPSAGVDVELRHDMWRMVRELRAQGTTIILTTHYIEEAEDMADRIGVISKGELIIVEDKEVLMRKLGKKQLTLTLRQPMTSIPAGLSTWSLALSDDGHALVYSFDTQEEETGIAALLRVLGEHSIEFKDLRSSESSLEDIFVSLVHQPKGTLK